MSTVGASSHAEHESDAEITGRQATEPIDRLLRDLRTRPDGLTPAEVERRRRIYGPNELARRGGSKWPRQLGRQFVHPFALLLFAAAALAFLERSFVLGIAILGVIGVNAIVAFVQERHAERAVEALREYLPQTAAVLRAGRRIVVPATELVPGDVMLIEEGSRISADARLLEGTVQIAMASLTGESPAVTRDSRLTDVSGPLLQARDLVFSGTECVGGRATGIVFATGMHTEIGRIAALSERVGHQRSPLERQVLRLAWTIAAVGIAAALAFLLVGVLVAGLTLSDSATFAIGLLVANVPEGLLPTLTLALAMAVRLLARNGALVKRLSAVETLGAASVICTDKTGTLTQNRMTVTDVWTLAGPRTFGNDEWRSDRDDLGQALGRVMLLCNDASIDPKRPEQSTGDPMEVALLRAALTMIPGLDPQARRRRRQTFPFDPRLERMSTVDEVAHQIVIHTKGAPETVVAHCTRVVDGQEGTRPLSDADRARITATVDDYADRGLRVLALAVREVEGPPPASREQAEQSLVFVGLAAMLDPPRPEVPDAIASCQRAGIRVIMITGDYGATAAAIARRVGLATTDPLVVTGAELDRMSQQELLRILDRPRPLIFARATPEAKLRVADALESQGHVVAMTGDGVNDAPALHKADIGVAMGRIGTDVAREAATVILTDDNFATIVSAVREGRRVYDNIRKFIVYILAHMPPEVVPFLLFALSGGAIPLPLTVLQILAIDLGTETIPALALGRETAEPDLMELPPRQRSKSIVEASVLLRAWLLLGGVSAVLVMLAFFFTLWRGGWSPGAPVGPGTPLHTTYLQATTMTFLGIVACQIGTAFASRTERVSLLRIGVTTNRFLLWGIGFEVVLSLLLLYVPPLAEIFGMAAPPLASWLLLIPLPFVVWSADEAHRALARRRHRAHAARASAASAEPGPALA